MNSQSQKTLDPEIAKEYISWVCEEIERRVAKKLSKVFSPTESRMLGALFNLDEFLLNPQVWTCSVTFPGTSRNNDSENRGPTGDCPLGDPCPAAVVSTHYCGELIDSDPKEANRRNPFKYSKPMNQTHITFTSSSDVNQTFHAWKWTQFLNQNS